MTGQQGPRVRGRSGVRDGNKHSCSICGKVLATERSLEMHIRTHTGERPYACDLCGKTYTGESGLRKHELTKHTKNNHGGRGGSAAVVAEVVPAEVMPAAESVESVPVAESVPAVYGGPVASVLEEDESVVRVLLHDRQVIVVPTCKKPVVVVPTDEVIMAVVPDCSVVVRSLDQEEPPPPPPSLPVLAGTAAEFLESWRPDDWDAATAGPEPSSTAVETAADGDVLAEWPDLTMWTPQQLAEPTTELDDFLEQLCRNELPPTPPPRSAVDVGCDTNVLQASTSQHVILDPPEPWREWPPPLGVRDPVTGLTPYPCDVCGNKSRRVDGTCGRAWSTAREYLCRVCGAKQYGRAAYRVHMQTEHPRNVREPRHKQPTECPLCVIPMCSRHSLFRHLRKKHGFFNFPCYACSIPTTYANAFREYVDHHSPGCERVLGPYPPVLLEAEGSASAPERQPPPPPPLSSLVLESKHPSWMVTITPHRPTAAEQ